LLGSLYLNKTQKSNKKPYFRNSLKREFLLFLCTVLFSGLRRNPAITCFFVTAQVPHPTLSQANQPAQKRAGRRRDETWFSGLVLKINPPWPRLSDSVAPGAGLSETGPFFKGGKEHCPKGIPPFTKKGG